MPNWLRMILLGAAEFAVRLLGGKSYGEGYQEGFRACAAEQERLADDAKARMDSVPDATVDGVRDKLDKGTF